MILKSTYFLPGLALKMQFLLPLLLMVITSKSQIPAAIIPDFSFEKANGTAFTKKDLTAGLPSFFVFFDTECDHCLHAIEFLDKHQPQLQKAKLYLITLGAKDQVKTFLSKHGASLVKAKNTTLLFDTKNQFITRFGPRKYPSLMLYSAGGKLLLYEDDEQKLPVFLKKISETKR
ncbi:MAG: hypothetical protein DI535_00280 [Citrobacter freundii]|nr:MAG: hypothetical protein DI535_00280 [Citrobacter freundii]